MHIEAQLHTKQQIRKTYSVKRGSNPHTVCADGLTGHYRLLHYEAYHDKCWPGCSVRGGDVWQLVWFLLQRFSA